MTTLEEPAQIDDAAVDARMNAFREQLKSMRVPGARPQSDRVLSVLAVVAMVVSLVLGIVAYSMSHGTTNPLEQNDATVLAILAVTIAVIGVGVFIKKGIERLLRFWIARITFEQNAQTERLLAQGEELHQLLREMLRERQASPPR
jgi:hypothetical protein